MLGCRQHLPKDCVRWPLMNIKCMSSVPSLSLHSLLHGINDCERYINGVDPAKAGLVEKGGQRWQGNGHRNRDKETPTGSRGIILAAVPRLCPLPCTHSAGPALHHSLETKQRPPRDSCAPARTWLGRWGWLLSLGGGWGRKG